MRFKHSCLVALMFALAVPAFSVTQTDIATGLSGAIGIAADPGGNAVYFVEFSTGTLKRVATTPGCTPLTCLPTPVASGFQHPEDVALDMAHNAAYVTTRDGPGALNSGALWRVDLGTGLPALVTFNLEGPQQIALDVATNSAYVVGFTGGRLWQIDLASGSKTTIVSGLGNPVGLVLTADRTRAYVSEQTPTPRISAIDVATHTRIGTVVSSGLTNPFFLRFTDPAEVALFVVQRDPANSVVRVELPTSTTSTPITGLPFRPSALTVDLLRAAVYVATDTKIVRVDRSELPDGAVFLAVGQIPSTDIDNAGYATSASPLPVQDAPFGGTVDIIGNFTKFKALGATHYRVLVSQNGGAFTPVNLSWNASFFNSSRYEATPVAPDSDGRYKLPAQPEFWLPLFQLLRWPTGVNGVYSFKVELFKPGAAAGSWDSVPLVPPPPFPPPPSPPPPSPSAGNLLTLRVDNDLPQTELIHIYQTGAADANFVKACQIVTSGANHFEVKFTAHDPNGHLASYQVYALFGNNSTATIVPTETYASHVNADGLHHWNGVVNHRDPSGGWAATCNCAHTFILDAWKRTTDGRQPLLHGTWHQSITINNIASPTCPENAP
jgi:DNA-binding beta-propeller fold protein YncE